MGVDYQEQSVPQLKPIDQRIILSQSSEQVWKEQLSDIHLYHGTSDVIARQIQQQGLSPKSKPYLPDDNDLLIGILNKLDFTHGYATRKDKSLFITASLASACGYAMDGPEMLRIFYLSSIDDIVKAWEIGNATSSGVTALEMERIKELRKKTIDFLNKHRPALVEIKRDSKVFNSILQDSLGELYELYNNPQAFTAKVKQFVSDNEGITEIEAAKILIGSIKEQIGEIVISKEIPSEELEFKFGKEFDDINNVTKTRAKIINTCFSDVEEQPSELIQVLMGYIFYDSGTEKNIVGICKYYNIDEDKTQRIIEGAQRLKEEGKSSV